MMSKKPPTPDRQYTILRDELEQLYQRRRLLDHIIRSMEVYSRFEQRGRARSGRVA